MIRVLLVTLLLAGCTSTGNWNFAGFSMFNKDSTITNDIDVTQLNVHTELNRPLTKEEVKQVEKSVEEGLSMVKEAMEKQTYMGASLHYVRAGKRDWPGWEDPTLTREEFLERHPKMKDAHKDLITLMHEIWKIHPTFIVTATLRDAERQKELVRRGFSQTQKSKHLRVPAEAADVVGKRKGKVDWKDIPIFGTYHGIALGLAEYLERLPCHMFGSRVRRVIDWKSFQDLPHHEILPKKECKKKSVTYTTPYGIRPYGHSYWEKVWEFDSVKKEWITHIPIRTKANTIFVPMRMRKQEEYSWGLS